MKIAVVGAGISGLTAAYRLTQAGHMVTVYEAADRPGGKIHSAREDGFLVEWAANGVLSGRTHVFDLAVELGLTPMPADEAAADTPPLVVIHGLLGSADNWRSHLKVWQGSRRVIALDRDGLPVFEVLSVDDRSHLRLICELGDAS